MDLFTPVVSEDVQHANFRSISKFSSKFDREVLNEWAHEFKDREGKIRKGVPDDLRFQLLGILSFRDS
jgi:hypothetical protein